MPISLPIVFHQLFVCHCNSFADKTLFGSSTIFVFCFLVSLLEILIGKKFFETYFWNASFIQLICFRKSVFLFVKRVFEKYSAKLYFEMASKQFTASNFELVHGIEGPPVLRTSFLCNIIFVLMISILNSSF